ncbi:MAG: DUF4382 domain-containing protein [Myxococcaceae bacterium]
MHRHITTWSCLPLLLLSCQPQETQSGPPAGYGRLQVELVDAPNPQVKEINVTISKVTAHSSSAGWVAIYSGAPITVDLLKLKTHALQLGFANLPAGRVTQIRLHTLEGGVQEVVLPDGSHVALKVPSGTKSGIKVKGPFELSACTASTVTLDFDGHKSIWVHPTGQGDEWILRPVIHAKRVQTQAAPCSGPDAGAPTDSGGTDGGEPPFLDGGGAPCQLSTECLSGVCTAGICAVGAAGSPCRSAADCAGNVCTADGICGPGSAGGTGTPCAVNTDCLSGTCTAGVCATGTQGNPCISAADCGEGFTCDTGSCSPIIN